MIGHHEQHVDAARELIQHCFRQKGCGHRKGACLKERRWHQRPHEGWNIGHAKQQQEHGCTQEKVGRQEEAQADEDDCARLNCVMCRNCATSLLSECAKHCAEQQSIVLRMQ